ncbi:peptidase T [Thermoclostridium stercorarium subsp. stercorarium DSM 8532]|jgi:tripeptide aminopeptidase|uniref:Peptidase T n=3 Tax=Thermoclostridium stercorarium TaxID=1510 RepID=L7VLK2_THES1|nr:peptidase T [Thermoclostridium stercorarium]AGC67376.1 peptidase T [Thermoclostridium stercorarium subsp. stercorarium DSM 8532]AGI38437.1 peptidase [Thermoclostridium stercorarium subsp. stercorarium DSM 8532]ANW97868.1 peptidase T [Thermoclostridium stercorarium subsp. thermolacticum DSM 2910]ANX00422.1 peptidase T [Thermoclostridium stercorarium subsp. leptospartum DSM 9219]
MDALVERFLKYVSFDTQSDENSDTCPSTQKQYEFGKYLVEELRQIGLKDAEIDRNGYVYATLNGNTEKKVPVIGFIAHMDTSPDMTGANVKPRIIENYDGGDIVLNSEKNIVLSVERFPNMLTVKGHDIIVTDGTTLLGADDKAGIAEIVTAAEYLIKHPEIKHGTIKIAFTPDEEIGRGVDHFDVKKFGAEFAYTVDGGIEGQIEYENFNAAYAKITVNGVNVHPGSAKNRMKNSILIAMELNSMLPAAETPSHTEGYEGFFHLNNIEGDVEKTSLYYIIRDHDMKRFSERKKLIGEIVDFINYKYGEGTVVLEMKDQYYNMKEKIEPVMHVVDLAKKAMEQSGVKPVVTPIRGGTDGARLSYMGIPTPNIFTGGQNYHGKFEFVSVNSMKKAVEVIIRIAELAAK